MPRSPSTTKKTPSVGPSDSSAASADSPVHSLSMQPGPDQSPQDHSDANSIRVSGLLAPDPDIRSFPSGSSVANLLVTARTHVQRRRTDVVPVAVWDPDASVLNAHRGDGVSITGMLQRRFWTGSEGRSSRLEVVAFATDVTPAEPPV